MESVPNNPDVFYNVGSPSYMSPEAYKRNVYSDKSDIWALGVVLYEMLVGKTFDVGQTIEQCFENLLQRGIPFPKTVSSYMRKLIAGMLSFSLEGRFDCNKIQFELSHIRNEMKAKQQQF
eukprot:GHVR01143848.1.p1 GENE.GHVR01143848.1~~GHVR01143848.1.p1  ORF type:complete len:120 (+),score=14.06 GHVR01143848.1:377-736(+)